MPLSYLHAKLPCFMISQAAQVLLRCLYSNISSLHSSALRSDTLWHAVFPGLQHLCFMCKRILHVCMSWSRIPMTAVSIGRGEFSRNKRRHFITASFRPTWPGDESMPALSLPRYQLQATVFHSGRKDTGLYRTLERLAWCFSFPYLHIFYHLLCKEGCKCKHRIHLC